MVEIGYLIDDDIHDIFITNVQSIKNESLIEAKRKADLYKENEFIELTDIFSTEFRKFSPHVNFALILISTLILTLTLMLSCLRLFLSENFKVFLCIPMDTSILTLARQFIE